MRRRAAIATLVLVSWVTGSALGAIGPTAPAVAQTGIAIGKAHAGFAPSLTGTKPIVLLAVGSGARPGEDILHSLADSLHLISLNPARHRATIIGIPRDSWVTVPDHGTSKINASLVQGGPELLVRTIESISGLTIDYWAITTFWGITDLVNDLGGLTLDVPFSMSDPYSRSDFQPGVQHLEGSQVLAFSRDRHSFNQGDFARSENGGRVLLALLAQFRTEFQRDQSNLFTWIGAGMRNVETSVPLSEALDLAFTVSHLNPKGVTNAVLPGSSGTEGGLSVVFLSSAKDAIFADVRPDGILSKRNRPPSPTAGET